jgi:hypothetical protein
MPSHVNSVTVWIRVHWTPRREVGEYYVASRYDLSFDANVYSACFLSMQQTTEVSV